MVSTLSLKRSRPPRNREQQGRSGWARRQRQDTVYEEMLEEFEQIGKEALGDLRKVSSLKDLEEFRIKYLSRKGQVTQLLGRIGKLPREHKPKAGQLANKIKNNQLREKTIKLLKEPEISNAEMIYPKADYKKAPSNETLQEHITSIEKIIEKSEYFGKKVPPGIYCEYGYYFLQEGNYVDAKKYFVLEMQIYPESEVFIKQLILRIPEEKEKG